MILLIIAIVAALGAAYALWGRAWLKSKSWAKPFFDLIEPIEVKLWQKSETLLFARLLSWVGVLITAYDFVVALAPGMDWTPVTSILLRGVPESMRPVVASALVALIGLAMAHLRKLTTKPLELVAIPDKDMPPAVAEAVAVADAAKATAVAAVAEAKQDGAL